MPTYTCSSVAGLLSPQKKHAVAEAVTTAHAEVTGAPPYFAQLRFLTLAPGDTFIGGRELKHDHLFICGQIRDGRSLQDRKSLILRITRDVAAVLALDATAIWVYLQELPAIAMVEFGHILPQAGDEADWLAGLPDADRDFMQKITR